MRNPNNQTGGRVAFGWSWIHDLCISKIPFVLLLFLLITHIIIFRWKVQVASKGLYFRKPKVSLISCCSLIFACRSVDIQALYVLLRFCPWTTTSLWGPTLWWRSTSTHTARRRPPSSPAASSTRSESSNRFVWIHKSNANVYRILNMNAKLSLSSLSETSEKPSAPYWRLLFFFFLCSSGCLFPVWHQRLFSAGM